MSDLSTLSRIEDIVGRDNCLSAESDMASYTTDWRNLYKSLPLAVVRPVSTLDVSRIVALCREARIPIVPQGGNTGLVGGSAVPGERRQIILNLSRMNRIRAVDPDDFAITVEAGCILHDIQQAALHVDRLFPLSLGAEGSCTIGGNLATNAGGLNVLRYGMVRDLTLGLEVVLPDGEVLDLMGSLRKDNTGFDLKGLYVGSEGCLGIITAACLKLFPKPRQRETCFLAIEGLDRATDLLGLFRDQTADLLSAFEIIPRTGLDLAVKHVPGTRPALSTSSEFYLLIELTSSRDEPGQLRAMLEALLEDALTRELVLDGTIAQNDQQRESLWRTREAIVEAQALEGPQLKHDVAVPISRVAEFIASAERAVEAILPGILVVPFGHFGDGNIHFNLSPARNRTAATFRDKSSALSEAVYDMAVSMGGTISAEHGIGLLKKKELAAYRPAQVAAMKILKQALDPGNILNPGKIFD